MNPTEEKVPVETFFLLKDKDNKVIGIINKKFNENEK